MCSSDLFYGGHIAFAMDSLKTLVANVADLLDRQLALLVDVRYNHGLPSNLSGASAERAMLNHGFKAVQIGASAWTAEALKNTMPASVFSRSTECHNQDNSVKKVTPPPAAKPEQTQTAPKAAVTTVAPAPKKAPTIPIPVRMPGRCL